jgi:hypothetical protein
VTSRAASTSSIQTSVPVQSKITPFGQSVMGWPGVFLLYRRA